MSIPVVSLIVFPLFLQGCSTILNETFGQIEFTTTSYNDVRCNWKMHSAGINEAVAFITVQEVNLYNCRYVIFHKRRQVFQQGQNRSKHEAECRLLLLLASVWKS